MSFEEWFKELTKIAVSKGFIHGGDPEKWRSEFDKGLTPMEAWNGDWDLY